MHHPEITYEKMLYCFQVELYIYVCVGIVSESTDKCIMNFSYLQIFYNIILIVKQLLWYGYKICI